MLNNISFTRYFKTKSPIHSSNAFFKLLSLLFLMSIILITSSALISGLLTLITILLISLSNVPYKAYVKAVWRLKYLILFIFVLNLITGEIISNNLLLVNKIVEICFLSSMLVFTTKTEDLIYGLEKLLSPLKFIGFKTKEIALSISLAINFIPIIFEQSNKVYKAQAARGLDYKALSFNEKVKTSKTLIIPMFINSINRADNIAVTLENKFYGLNNKTTSYKIKNINVYDIMLLTLDFFVIVVLMKRG